MINAYAQRLITRALVGRDEVYVIPAVGLVSHYFARSREWTFLLRVWGGAATVVAQWDSGLDDGQMAGWQKV